MITPEDEISCECQWSGKLSDLHISHLAVRPMRFFCPSCAAEFNDPYHRRATLKIGEVVDPEDERLKPDRGLPGMTAKEIARGKAGTPGRLEVPASSEGVPIAMGDVIEITGSDPDFHGLIRKWRGTVVEIKSDGGFVLEGRFWIGNRAAMETLNAVHP